MTNQDIDFIEAELFAAGTLPKTYKAKYGSDISKWPASHLKNAFERIESGRTQAGWTIAPPQAPIKSISNPSGVGINANYGAQLYSDRICLTGTSDSALLVQPGGNGSSFKRVDIRKGGSLRPGPGWHTHGGYFKGLNVLVEDAKIQSDPEVASSSISLRGAGFVIRRFILDGLNVEIFNELGVNGNILFEDGIIVGYHPETCCWMDGSGYTVTFKNVDFKGNNKYALNSSDTTDYKVIVDNCLRNGASFTSADSGLRGGTLQIV